MSHVDMDPVKHQIDGHRVGSAKRFVTTNPTTGEAIAEMTSGGEAEINVTVAAAKVAFPAWANTPAKQHAKLMRRLGELVEQNAPHLAVLKMMDTGLPIAQTNKQFIPCTSESSHFFAEVYMRINGRAYPVDSQMLNYMLYQPVDAYALISSQNMPFVTATWKVVPCLALSNTAVLKVSELSPLTADQLGRLVLETDIPPGVFNVVQGYGATAGDVLMRHPGIQMMSFIGGATTGKHIIEHAGLKKFLVKLGDKSPMLVSDDMDLDRVLDASLLTIFSIDDERYTADSHIFVQESAYDNFVRKFTERAERLVVDDPAGETTHISSMIMRAHWEKVTGYIRLGEQEGTKILVGGAEKPAGLSGHLQNGNFVALTALANVDNHMRMAQEKIFGPVACLIPLKDETDGLKLANDMEYGLASYIWMQDMDKVHRVARGVEADMVFANSQNVRDLRQPFGGVKASSIGCEGGEYSLEVSAKIKDVCISMGSHHIPHWSV